MKLLSRLRSMSGPAETDFDLSAMEKAIAEASARWYGNSSDRRPFATAIADAVRAELARQQIIR